MSITNNELENKAICSLCDGIFDPNLFTVTTMILLGPNSGLSNRNEFVICRKCYKNLAEKLIDYPENKKYKRVHDPIDLYEKIKKWKNQRSEGNEFSS